LIQISDLCFGWWDYIFGVPNRFKRMIYCMTYWYSLQEPIYMIILLSKTEAYFCK